MSGSGSNVEKLLEWIERSTNESTWIPAVIVTDAPRTSRAEEIAEKWSIPLVKHDIRAFYKERGEERMSLATERGREIRGEWTEELRALLAPFNISFGVLAGFVPLTNITSDFPCLNVHPGDLTVTENGKRILVGLHTIPIEIAILRGFSSMRSSVIIAQTYTGAGGEMDTGPILGVSKPVSIDLMGKSLSELAKIAELRPKKRPKGGFADALAIIAKHNQERLKMKGDWTVFPPVVADFAAGRFAQGDEQDSMLFRQENGGWISAVTVEYGNNDERKILE
jgi:folate-dependent phosphoribosylglycinamide formyltransferase PurN